MAKNEYLLAAKQGKNGFWRYVLVITFVVIGMLVTQAILLGLAALKEGNFDIFSFPPITLLWVSMLPFSVALICVLLGVQFIHKRSIWTLISPLKNFRWKILIFAGSLWFALSAFSDLILSFLQPGNYQFNSDLSGILIYFLLAFFLLIVQVSAEEFFFRGYIMQMVGLVSSWVVLPLVFQAILFGALHGANTEVSTYGFWTTMPFYLAMGLLLGFITLRTNGLEASLGLHFANNLYATSFVTFSGSSIASPALFKISNYQPITSLIVFFIITVVYLLVFLYFSPSLAEKNIAQPD